MNTVARRALVPAVVGVGCLGAMADPFRESARESAEPLPVEEAFVFTSWLQGERLVAHWDMPKGYYLYRHRIEVDAGEGIALGKPAIPRGEPKTDAYFGESEVHYGSVEITVPVLQRPAVVAARITYQGCADSGFCYPPQARSVVHEAGKRAPASTAACAAASSELADSIGARSAGAGSAGAGSAEQSTPAAVAAAEG